MYTKNTCVFCEAPFELNVNIFSDAGIRETSISGSCEKCWDRMFAEQEESEDDYLEDDRFAREEFEEQEYDYYLIDKYQEEDYRLPIEEEASLYIDDLIGDLYDGEG